MHGRCTSKWRHSPKPRAQGELRLRGRLALEANPQLSQRQPAQGFGVSLDSGNYAFNTLVEWGFVKADNFRKLGSKVVYLYVPTPKCCGEKESLVPPLLGQKFKEYEVLR